MSRFFKSLAFFILGLTLFFFVWQKAGAGQFKLALGLFLGPAGILALFCTIFFIVVGVLKWQNILKNLSKHFTFKSLGDIWLTGSAISYFTPFTIFGGEVFEIYFLQKRFKKLPKPLGMASVAIDKLLDSTVLFVFLVCGSLALAFFGYLPNSAFGVGLLLTAGLFLLVLLVFYLRRVQGKTILGKFFAKGDSDAKNNMLLAEEQVFKFFSLKNKGLWYGFLLSFLRYSGLFLRAFVLIFFLTGEVSFLKTLAVFGFSSLAALTPAPAGLGSLELASGIAFSALGLGFASGVAFSLAWRLSDILVYTVGAFLFLKLSGEAFKEKVCGFFHR